MWYFASADPRFTNVVSNVAWSSVGQGVYGHDLQERSWRLMLRLEHSDILMNDRL